MDLSLPHWLTWQLARRIGGALLVAVLGAWIGLLAGGWVHKDVGPVETRMTMRPSFTGNTVVKVAPLGTITLDSHTGPLRLNVDIEELKVADARKIFQDPTVLAGLQDQIADDAKSGVTQLVTRSIAAGILATAVLSGLVYRHHLRRAAIPTGLAAVLVLGSSGIAAASWEPRSLAEPRYSGLLANAPSVVGNVQEIVADFADYSDSLARLVTNVSKLYDVTSALPAQSPDPSTLRILHVSDLHINPAGWDVIRSIKNQFKINVIVDSGDISDHGTPVEDRYVEAIGELGVPYVYVRGNHDSATTQEAVEAQRNAVVLAGRVREVAGLRFIGDGDPRFTPDKTTDVPEDDQVRAMGQRVAAEALRAGFVDIGVVHDPVAGEEMDGSVPLVLAGHLHFRKQRVLPGGTRLMIQGSTGGGGLRALEKNPPEPIRATVLYLDRNTKELVAWDEITVGGLGLTSAEIKRTLPKPPASPTPSPGATPTGSPATSLSPTP